MRDISIDVLRSLALLGLMLIHISPPYLFLREFRSFDVPMMVFLSGVVYNLSDSYKGNYFQYVKKRFIRLILPTWIFLIVYYAVHAVCQNNSDLIYNFLFSLTLMDGWYPWIMRLFFVIALLSPITEIFNKISRKHFLLITIFLFVINELLVSWLNLDGQGSHILVIIEMNFPFFIVFCIGSQIHKFSEKQVKYLAVASLLVLFICMILHSLAKGGEYCAFNNLKYPPHFYYIIYGLTVIFFSWYYRKQIVSLLDKMHILNILVFVGSHTMWIYFWHIFLVELVLERIEFASLRYAIVAIGAVTITYLQSKLVVYTINHIKSSSTSRLIGILFNG